MLAHSYSQRSPYSQRSLYSQSSEPGAWGVPLMTSEGGKLSLWGPQVPTSSERVLVRFSEPEASVCVCVCNCSHPVNSGSGPQSLTPAPWRASASPLSWPPGCSDYLSRCPWGSCSALLPEPHCSTGSLLGHFTFPPDPCNPGQTFPVHKATLLQLVSHPRSQSSGWKSQLCSRPRPQAGL